MHRIVRLALAAGAGLMAAAGATAGYRDAVVAHQVASGVADSVIVGAATGPAGAEKFFVCFRFEGLLWWYGPDAGTRICGPAGPAWPPPAAALLEWARQGDPGLTAVAIHRGPNQPENNQADLPNGCVIACLAQLVGVVAETGRPDEVGLVLFYYARPPVAGVVVPGVVDHSILVYRHADQWFCRDPRRGAPLPLREVAIGAHLDPTLRVLAGRPDDGLEHARLLVISPRTLDQVAAGVAWRSALRRGP